jgi:rod shape-determining protein MreD
MAIVISIILSFVALGLQATVVPHIAIAGIRPDLAIVVTVLLGTARGSTHGTIAGFCIGLAQDLTNPAFLGLNALTKSLLGFTSGTLRGHLNASNLPMHAGVLFLAVLGHDLVYWTIFTHLALSDLFMGLLTRSLPTALYTAVVGMWAFLAVGALSGRGGRALGRPSFARR